MLCWRVPVMFWAEHQTCQSVMFPSGCVPFLLRKSWTWHWYVDVISSSEGWITSHLMFSVVLSNYVVMPVDPPLKIRFSTSTVKMYTFSSECDQASFKDWWGPKWSADITFCSIFASQQSNQSAMFFNKEVKTSAFAENPEGQTKWLTCCMCTDLELLQYLCEMSEISHTKSQVIGNIQGLCSIPGWCLSALLSQSWFNGQRENVGLSTWAELWGWCVLHRNGNCCFAAASLIKYQVSVISSQ